MQAWKFRGAYVSTCKTLFPLFFCSDGYMRVNRELEHHAECTMKIISWKQAQIHPVTCMNFGFRWTRQQVHWQRPRSPQCTWQLLAMWQAPSPVSTLTPFCLQGCGSLAPGKGWPLLLWPLFLLILFFSFSVFLLHIFIHESLAENLGQINLGKATADIRPALSIPSSVSRIKNRDFFFLVPSLPSSFFLLLFFPLLPVSVSFGLSIIFLLLDLLFLLLLDLFPQCFPQRSAETSETWFYDVILKSHKIWEERKLFFVFYTSQSAGVLILFQMLFKLGQSVLSELWSTFGFVTNRSVVFVCRLSYADSPGERQCPVTTTDKQR